MACCACVRVYLPYVQLCDEAGVCFFVRRASRFLALFFDHYCNYAHGLVLPPQLRVCACGCVVCVRSNVCGRGVVFLLAGEVLTRNVGRVNESLVCHASSIICRRILLTIMLERTECIPASGGDIAPLG